MSSGTTKVVRALFLSHRFPSFLVVSRRFSGVLPRMHIRCGHRGPAVVHDRPDPDRIASETCIATRVRCTLRNVQFFSSQVRTKSLVVGQPGQPPVHQFSGNSIPTQVFQEQSLRCSVIWSLKAVSPYFALLFSSPLCLSSCSDRPKLVGLQYNRAIVIRSLAL